MDRAEPKLINFVLATDISQRMRVALEISAVAAIIMILTAFASNTYRHYIAITQVSEGLSLVSTRKVDMVEYRAIHGSWPKPSDNELRMPDNNDFGLGKFVSEVSLTPNGGVDIVFSSDNASTSLRGKTLTLRLATVKENSSGPVSLVCGDGVLPPGLTSSAANRTSIAGVDLPSI